MAVSSTRPPLWPRLLDVHGYGHIIVRACLHLEQRPGLISLLAGKPHSSTFPFTSLNFTYRDPTDPALEVPVELTASELECALQYSPTIGIPELVDWLYGLQETLHGRKRGEGWKLSVGNGVQDLMYKVTIIRILDHSYIV